MVTKNKYLRMDEKVNKKLLDEMRIAMEAGEEFFILNTGEKIFLALRIIHRRKIKVVLF